MKEIPERDSNQQPPKRDLNLVGRLDEGRYEGSDWKPRDSKTEASQKPPPQSF